MVQVIFSNTQYIDWVHEVSEQVSRALNAAKFYNSFYTSSFLIYMLASLQLWLGLPRIEDFPDNVKRYEFYPCLQLQNSYAEYIQVNDAFTMRTYRELQGHQNKDLVKKQWRSSANLAITSSSSHHFLICILQHSTNSY